jgi:ADP-ribosylglycohydrolase
LLFFLCSNRAWRTLSFFPGGYALDYYDFHEIEMKLRRIKDHSDLKHEYGADVEGSLSTLERYLDGKLEEIRTLPEDRKLAQDEPDELTHIRALRSPGPRRLWAAIPEEKLAERMSGAFLGRLAGNVLGAPVENLPVEVMEQIADFSGMGFPPRDYWTIVPAPYLKKYGFSFQGCYARDKLDRAPIDDDIAYTLLGLLSLERFGPDITTENIAEMWDRYLPLAFTAEEIALRNYRNRLPIDKVAEVDNPYVQWIGADIRSDPWAYSWAGFPEKAAEFAYRDASLSHRRNGIYGEMFFAAAQAAAFAVDDAREAVKIGLTEIPSSCALHREIEWALSVGDGIGDYREARAAVDARFAGMSHVHTENNACLTVFGLLMGKSDFSAVISGTVAMGMDNDCTAATAGSIAGAILGRGGIPSSWYDCFHGRVDTYLKGMEPFSIGDVVDRFVRQVHVMYESVVANPDT